MVGPFTPNAGFIVPNTGDFVDTWGEDATNPDYVAIDGMLCGVQTITLGSSPVTLTSETGFTATPGAGPTQSQNRGLRFSGVLTANVTVTLPIPASYLCENLCTGNFTVTLRGATATEVVCLPPGEIVEVYNDGANVRFVGLGRMGEMEHWAGISALPAWVTGCTKRPYLLCDDTVYNIADYPFLGARFLAQFGGNGLTTFANPDMRGRVPLAYDGSAARITTAGSGIDGDTLGSAGGAENITLASNQIPTLTSVNAAQSITVYPGGDSTNRVPQLTSPHSFSQSSNSAAGGSQPVIVSDATGNSVTNQNSFSAANSISVTYTNASQQASRVVQPSIVTGIWVVKT